jgi:predicted O-methyltransferase YrrM
MAGRARDKTQRVAVHQEVADGRLADLVPDLDHAGSWLLYLGDAPQSQVDLDNPKFLEFEYIQRIAHLLDTIAPAGAPLRVLHLGGGALTLPRYVAATRPGSSQLVAEYDAALMDLVREHLPLGRARHRIRVRIGDAREVLASVAPGRFDVVISDVFAGARTPPHLTTVECAQLAARALTADGVFIQNVADGPPLGFAKQQVATVASVFPYGLLVAEPAVLRRRRFGNLVLAGSRRPLPAAELSRLAAADPFPARVLDGEDLERFVSGARPATDATAQPSPLPPPSVLTGPADVTTRTD